MLLAGASVNNDPVWCGSFTFDVGLFPSGTWWAYGSAFMLVAGASVSDPSAAAGDFSFYVYPSPSATHWSIGSASF